MDDACMAFDDVLNAADELVEMCNAASTQISRLLKRIKRIDHVKKIASYSIVDSEVKSEEDLRDMINQIKDNYDFDSMIRDEWIKVLKTIIDYRFTKRDILDWYEMIRHPAGMCPDYLRDEIIKEMVILRWTIDPNADKHVFDEGILEYEMAHGIYTSSIYDDFLSDNGDHEISEHPKISMVSRIHSLDETIKSMDWVTRNLRDHPDRIRSAIRYLYQQMIEPLTQEVDHIVDNLRSIREMSDEHE